MLQSPVHGKKHKSSKAYSVGIYIYIFLPWKSYNIWKTVPTLKEWGRGKKRKGREREEQKRKKGKARQVRQRTGGWPFTVVLVSAWWMHTVDAQCTHKWTGQTASWWRSCTNFHTAAVALLLLVLLQVARGLRSQGRAPSFPSSSAVEAPLHAHQTVLRAAAGRVEAALSAASTTKHHQQQQHIRRETLRCFCLARALSQSVTQSVSQAVRDSVNQSHVWTRKSIVADPNSQPPSFSSHNNKKIAIFFSFILSKSNKLEFFRR